MAPDGIERDEKTVNYGLDGDVSRGRRPGQKAPREPGADPGGRPQSAAPAQPDGPMAIAPPVNHMAALLNRYGKHPSMKHPNGPMPELQHGRIEFNPFENRWIE